MVGCFPWSASRLLAGRSSRLTSWLIQSVSADSICRPSRAERRHTMSVHSVLVRYEIEDLGQPAPLHQGCVRWALFSGATSSGGSRANRRLSSFNAISLAFGSSPEMPPDGRRADRIARRPDQQGRDREAAQVCFATRRAFVDPGRSSWLHHSRSGAIGIVCP